MHDTRGVFIKKSSAWTASQFFVRPNGKQLNGHPQYLFSRIVARQSIFHLTPFCVLADSLGVIDQNILRGSQKCRYTRRVVIYTTSSNSAADIFCSVFLSAPPDCDWGKFE